MAATTVEAEARKVVSSAQPMPDARRADGHGQREVDVGVVVDVRGEFGRGHTDEADDQSPEEGGQHVTLDAALSPIIFGEIGILDSNLLHIR
ncbi:hypothetical protein [Nonomuraea dietziae]|uniref:hypothetical protein n=1 Tax=Nonomuraea dietziae TaxID=65515 RepID=UPI0031CE5E0B